jgi:hypothetical protein
MTEVDGKTFMEDLERSTRIDERNNMIRAIQTRCRSRLGRVICAVLPHRWLHVHQFDEPGLPPDPPYRGSSHYAGVCLRCGTRDLFSGPLRAEGREKIMKEWEAATGTERYLAPRKVGNLMGVAYVDGLRSLTRPLRPDEPAISSHQRSQGE